jgi:KDO2-lipid IV(A) lauroyltransferase
MIDQRVTEGIKSKFFDEDAFTTTIPAQFIKKLIILKKICGITMEEHFLNTFFLKILETIN